MMIVLSKTNVHTILYSVPYLSIMFFQAYIKGNCGNIIVNPDNNYCIGIMVKRAFSWTTALLVSFNLYMMENIIN